MTSIYTKPLTEKVNDFSHTLDEFVSNKQCVCLLPIYGEHFPFRGTKILQYLDVLRKVDDC